MFQDDFHDTSELTIISKSLCVPQRRDRSRQRRWMHEPSRHDLRAQEQRRASAEMCHGVRRFCMRLSTRHPHSMHPWQIPHQSGNNSRQLPRSLRQCPKHPWQMPDLLKTPLHGCQVGCLFRTTQRPDSCGAPEYSIWNQPPYVPQCPGIVRPVHTRLPSIGLKIHFTVARSAECRTT